MRIRLLLMIALLVPAMACTRWGKPVKGWRGATGGEQLDKLFWQDVQAKNWVEVDRRVGGTFSGANEAGILDRAAFLKDLQRAPLTDFALSDCDAHLNGADMVIACKLRATWAGQTRDSTTLSVWQELSKGWVMVAHADSVSQPLNR